MKGGVVFKGAATRPAAWPQRHRSAPASTISTCSSSASRESSRPDLLSGRDGVALIDPGPSTTLATLKEALAARGVPLRRRTRDSADAHSSRPRRRHGIAPSRVSERDGVRARSRRADIWSIRRSSSPARRACTAPTWSGCGARSCRCRPTGFKIAGDERLHIVGHTVEVAQTPGHASHHVSYFLPDARRRVRRRHRGHLPRAAAASCCRRRRRRTSTSTPGGSARTGSCWNPDVLFLTHFGPHRSPRVHFGDLWTRMDDWSRRVRASLERPGTDAERAQQFTDEVMDDLARATSRAGGGGVRARPDDSIFRGRDWRGTGESTGCRRREERSRATS